MSTVGVVAGKGIDEHVDSSTIGREGIGVSKTFEEGTVNGLADD